MGFSVSSQSSNRAGSEVNGKEGDDTASIELGDFYDNMYNQTENQTRLSLRDAISEFHFRGLVFAKKCQCCQINLT